MPKGGDVKKAPEGYYTAKEAAKRLGMNISTFRYYVQKGRIKRHVPPLRKEGFYSRKEIDKLAIETALFLHTDEETAETRVAREEDAQGIVKVLTVRGWKTATAEQRVSWYKINPDIDYVAIWNGEVMGYVHAVPYTPTTLVAIMRGEKRSWHIIPEDILSYEPGKTYDLYVGIATRQDLENHEQHLGFRLISGFMTFLEELAEKGIVVRRMYAVSAELDGQKLCKRLGFIEQEAEEGDLFPRFVLDFETSGSHFAKLYREGIQ